MFRMWILFFLPVSLPLLRNSTPVQVHACALACVSFPFAADVTPVMFCEPFLRLWPWAADASLHVSHTQQSGWRGEGLSTPTTTSFDQLRREKERRKRKKPSSQLPSLCASVWEQFHTIFTLMRNWNRLGGGTWPSWGSEQSARVSKQTHKLHSSELRLTALRPARGYQIQLPPEFPKASLKPFPKYLLGCRSSVALRKCSSPPPRQVAVWDHQLAGQPMACPSARSPTSHPWPPVRLYIPCVLPIRELPIHVENTGKRGWTFIPFDHACCFTDVGMMWCNIGWFKWGRSITEKALQVCSAVQCSIV